jgi:hypothetical protein
VKAIITVVVEVHDTQAFLDYAQSMREAWGRDYDDNDTNQDIYDTIVLNEPPLGLLGVGLEIVAHDVRLGGEGSWSDR